MTRIALWAAFLTLVAGITYVGGGWEALKSQAQWMIFFGGGLLFVHALIVEPIQKQIKDLEHKIDYQNERLLDRLAGIRQHQESESRDRRFQDRSRY